MDKFPKHIITGEDPNTGEAVVGFEHDGMFIYDCFLSDCARFTVDPSHYGLTLEQGKLLAAANESIKAASERALNEACYLIQTRLGVTDGGFAGVFFSNDAMWDLWVTKTLAEYIAAQLNFGD